MDKHFTKKINKKVIILTVLAIGVGGYFLYKYISKLPALKYNYNTNTPVNVSYPDAKFGVISDLHMYNPILGDDGEAFESVMNSDRKLLLNSQDLISLSIQQIIDKNVDFVLVSGDLTKDGELINHQEVVSQLDNLRNNGIKTYVIMGNHDINNPSSVSFSGSLAEKTPTISKEMFVELYGEYGYNDAIYRDEYSLSYVAEPVNDLYILALDGCQYTYDVMPEHSFVGAKFSQGTIDWITNVLKKAYENNKAVIVLSHHGIVEHWKGQSKLHPDYLTFEHQFVSKLLASYGVRLAFTGHYHAQDIVEGTFENGNFIYDIETGSLVTAPCPYRIIDLKNNQANIETTTLVDKIYPDTSFAKEATAFVYKTVVSEAYNTLKKYYVSDTDAEYISNLVGEAFIAHYSGDENVNLKSMVDKSKLGIWGKIVFQVQQYVLDGLWNDLPPNDNNVVLPLSK